MLAKLKKKKWINKKFSFQEIINAIPISKTFLYISFWHEVIMHKETK